MHERLPRPGRRIAAGSVGLGWRTELAADLLAAPDAVDFVEIVAETCFAQPQARREARAVSELWPVVPHGVKLSLGSADGVDLGRARQLGSLALEVRAPAVSEHVAFTRGGAREIGHLTALPFTREAVRVVERNVARARRVLPDVPLLLENVAWSLRWPDDEMDEADFYSAIVEATGCDLLLDLANLYANALNAGRPPAELLERHPLERVAMVHLAGGTLDDGFYLDTHAHPVPGGVFDLLARLVERAGPVPVLIERDSRFPAFADLLAEVDEAREVVRRARKRAKTAAAHVPARFRPAGGATGAAAGDAPGSAGGLAARQAALAEALTSITPPGAALEADFGREPLARSRAILEHKRVDDALPLLPRAGRFDDLLRPLAFEVVRRSPRAPRGAGVADARRIAEAACGDPRLASFARLDLLELRSRFDPDSRPRRGPFLGRERLPDGRSVWAMKGPGHAAGVRLFEPGIRT